MINANPRNCSLVNVKIKLIHVIRLAAVMISEAMEIAILDVAIPMRINTTDDFNYASYYSVAFVNLWIAAIEDELANLLAMAKRSTVTTIRLDYVTTRIAQIKQAHQNAAATATADFLRN